ncbi:hypothetical protein BKH41_05975 [Helicobacter sp. 12S02232-10]|uniref:LPP20 family lipoprotein n=1 Tax=Helicobacter sp. 12S02232-10 TaxID=1476197 RepID=UPI000BA729D2|nr:LPP20 family lipoprotein [Helicobacter sp. 12S02232-10]PAF48260.1 hypothetical protein BKH41_05975 [Helicobacter sp. 12S02232-10]
MLKPLSKLFCVAFFFVGCMNVSGSLTPPSWFVSIPNDNTALYGNGIGKSLEESKQNAINDLASSIKVKINSSISLTNTQTDQNEHSEIFQNIHLSIETIELQDIKLVHSEYKNAQYYSQVKISKKTLLQTLKKEYQTLYEELHTFQNSHCKSLSIRDKNTLQSLLAKLDSLEQSIIALNPTSSLPSFKIYKDILNQNSPLPKAVLIFSPNSDPEIVNILSAEYAKFIRNTDEKNTHTIKNNISVHPQGNQISISLEADIYDCQNNVIFHTKIQSVQNNKTDALNRLKVQLYKKLQEYSQIKKNPIPQI